MKSHLDIELSGKPLTLPDDFSISMEERSPLFHDTEMFSWPVPIPLKGNREIVHNIEVPQADKRPMDLEHAPVRVIADGMPFKSGTVSMTEDEEVKDTITLNIDASRLSFEDLIGNLECQDVPVKDKIQIGEKIGNVKVDVDYKFSVRVTYRDGKKSDTVIQYTDVDTVTGTFEPQALGFSYPGICEVTGEKQKAIHKGTTHYPKNHEVKKPRVLTSFINVSDPYPAKPYCNARVAYMHYGLNDDGTTSDELIPLEDSVDSSAPEDHYPYWVLDADRPQSGICFYVLYFLECLFTYLEVDYDLSALTAIEDFNRLCFFTTHCKYDTEVAHAKEIDPETGEVTKPFFEANTEGQYEKTETEIGGLKIKLKRPILENLSETTFNKFLFGDINEWLESRGCGGKLLIPYPEPKQVEDFEYIKNGGTPTKVIVGVDDVASISIEATIKHAKVSANILSMYANSENFPEESVSTVLEALENSFGIKFHYDYEQKKVTAYLLRDVFRNDSAPIDFLGQILEMNKMAEKTTGIRMTYSAESDSKDQKKNIRKGVKNYDTDYDYIGYPKDKTVTDLTYEEITQTKPVENLSTYIDKNTGNTYRWKASQEALEDGVYQCSLFQVATFKGVELGDCSKENEEFIQNFTSDFVPVPFNDVNYRNREMLLGGKSSYEGTDGKDAYKILNINKDKATPLMSAFVDEDMEHEFVAQYINNGLPSLYANLYLTEELKTVESYDPSNTDDGNSPLQTYDWGLAIALMQGGGTDATTQEYDYNYDMFGNSRWRMVPGVYALTSDSLDLYGNPYDYNGDSSGIGGGERFSLKIRSWQQPSWADGPLVYDDEYDQQGNITKKIKTRGLCDTFMSEYFHFLLYRKKFKVHVLATAAQLNDITNHWRHRYRINGQVGWISKINYNISRSTGVKDVYLEFYSL